MAPPYFIWEALGRKQAHAERDLHSIKQWFDQSGLSVNVRKSKHISPRAAVTEVAEMYVESFVNQKAQAWLVRSSAQVKNSG
ncbi:hypothetical protein J6590_078755 [Homalodisca vitripennis]|nr:hypothetical protein J6590_078755 [Homalodisca vitripennis]